MPYSNNKYRNWRTVCSIANKEGWRSPRLDAKVGSTSRAALELETRRVRPHRTGTHHAQQTLLFSIIWHRYFRSAHSVWAVPAPLIRRICAHPACSCTPKPRQPIEEPHSRPGSAPDPSPEPTSSSSGSSRPDLESGRARLGHLLPSRLSQVRPQRRRGLCPRLWRDRSRSNNGGPLRHTAVRQRLRGHAHDVARASWRCRPGVRGGRGHHRPRRVSGRNGPNAMNCAVHP